MAPDSSVPIRYFSVLENTEQNEANVLLLCSTRLHRLSLVVGTTTSSLSFLHHTLLGLFYWIYGRMDQIQNLGLLENGKRRLRLLTPNANEAMAWLSCMV